MCFLQPSSAAYPHGHRSKLPGACGGLLRSGERGCLQVRGVLRFRLRPVGESGISLSLFLGLWRGAATLAQDFRETSQTYLEMPLDARPPRLPPPRARATDSSGLPLSPPPTPRFPCGRVISRSAMLLARPPRVQPAATAPPRRACARAALRLAALAARGEEEVQPVELQPWQARRHLSTLSLPSHLHSHRKEREAGAGAGGRAPPLQRAPAIFPVIPS